MSIFDYLFGSSQNANGPPMGIVPQAMFSQQGPAPIAPPVNMRSRAAIAENLQPPPAPPQAAPPAPPPGQMQGPPPASPDPLAGVYPDYLLKAFPQKENPGALQRALEGGGTIFDMIGSAVDKSGYDQNQTARRIQLIDSALKAKGNLWHGFGSTGTGYYESGPGFDPHPTAGSLEDLKTVSGIEAKTGGMHPNSGAVPVIGPNGEKGMWSMKSSGESEVYVGGRKVSDQEAQRYSPATAENTEDRQEGQSRQKYRESIRSNATAATNTMQYVNIFRDAAKNTGNPGTIGNAVRAAAQFFGADIGNVNLSNVQEAQTAVSNLSLSVAQQKLKGQGSVTDAERGIILSSLMQLATDPRAAGRIADTLEGIAKRDIDLQNGWNMYSASRDKPNIDEFNAMWTNAWSQAVQENPTAPQKTAVWNQFMGRDAPAAPPATGDTTQAAPPANPGGAVTGKTKSGIEYTVGPAASTVVPPGSTGSKIENGSPVVRMPIGGAPPEPEPAPIPAGFKPPSQGGPVFSSESAANAAAPRSQYYQLPAFADTPEIPDAAAIQPQATNVVRGRPMRNPPLDQASDYLVNLSRNSPRGKAFAKNADDVRGMIKELGRTKDFSRRRAIVETLKRQGFITE